MTEPFEPFQSQETRRIANESAGRKSGPCLGKGRRQVDGFCCLLLQKIPEFLYQSETKSSLGLLLVLTDLNDLRCFDGKEFDPYYFRVLRC
mmetsp:Transcript_6642/g.11484  ORF Transcript_6642/g.11484 Transcript_6642/m.11484 type:complete len:91 (+) Transcript_6642:1017-1289(+)